MPWSPLPRIALSDLLLGGADDAPLNRGIAEADSRLQQLRGASERHASAGFGGNDLAANAVVPYAFNFVGSAGFSLDENEHIITLAGSGAYLVLVSGQWFSADTTAGLLAGVLVQRWGGGSWIDAVGAQARRWSSDPAHGADFVGVGRIASAGAIDHQIRIRRSSSGPAAVNLDVFVEICGLAVGD
jgi:hypothetical protein